MASGGGGKDSSGRCSEGRRHQGFFSDQLIRQRQASPHTIAAYRDTFRLLLDHVWRTSGTAPSQLDFDQLDAIVIGAFLQHLQEGRDNSVSTRNARLAAVRSLFRYAALHVPDHADLISRVLAIPPKRCDRPVVAWLLHEEVHAVLAAPDRDHWHGRRDHALLTLACQTGLRDVPGA